MASSRKPPAKHKPDSAFLPESTEDRVLLSALQRAVEGAVSAPRSLADGRGQGGSDPAPRADIRLLGCRCGGVGSPSPAAAGEGGGEGVRVGLVLAYSGGPDSTALLDLACRLRDRGHAAFQSLLAVHVHHGLQDCADDWAEHCAAQCAARGVECVVRRVAVAWRARGVEAGARDARYGALVDAARKRGAAFVLTAHHADDRLETFLLQWLRGAGPAGLAGIAAARGAEYGEEGGDAVQVLRPFLDVPREAMANYVARYGLATIDDPSNADTRLARNAIRANVLPQLAAIRSGVRKSAARSIDLIADAAELVQELGAELLQWCMDGAPVDMLRIDRLATLTPTRQALVLRAWLARAGVEAPPRARLREALAQAIEGAPEGRMRIRFGRQELRRHRGLLCLRVPGADARGRERLLWRGEPELPVPSWGGVLRFLPTDAAGFDPDWLRAQPLDLRSRSGGERLKPHPARPSKHLKHWYQERGVPEFDRAALPLVWRDDRLIYAAGLGADVRFVEPGAGRIRIEWTGAEDLLTSVSAAHFGPGS